MTTDEQARHNRDLWHYYPLGIVNGMFEQFEYLRHYLNEDEKDDLDHVLWALGKFDVAMRARRYPVPK